MISYSCTYMYVLVCLGEIPYSSVGNDELLKHIRSGQRLEKPDSYINEEM